MHACIALVNSQLSFTSSSIFDSSSRYSTTSPSKRLSSESLSRRVDFKDLSFFRSTDSPLPIDSLIFVTNVRCLSRIFIFVFNFFFASAMFTTFTHAFLQSLAFNDLPGEFPWSRSMTRLMYRLNSKIFRRTKFSTIFQLFFLTNMCEVIFRGQMSIK